MHRRGSSLIELLVAISIFTVVSTAVVVLMQHAQTVTVWGDKKNEALRSNREINRRVSYVLRAAISRPAVGVLPAENPITSVTTVARNTDPAQPPYPAGHVETVEFWATVEDARRRVANPGFPAPQYPAAGSYDPRTIIDNMNTTLTRMRLSWAIDTGNLSLEMLDAGGAVVASRLLVNNEAGQNVIRTVDFTREDAARAVGLYLETRSRDPHSRFEERRYGSFTQIQIPAWQ